MSSEKQILANRINGLKGGIKSAEARAAVRLNAVSHGFFSNSVLVAGEDSHLLEEFRDNFINELQPEGEVETFLVERMVSSSWRLKRLLKAESKTPDKAGYDPDWQNYIRYETTLERQIYKALHELIVLRTIKIEQKAKEERDQALSEISALRKEALSRNSQNL